MTLTSTTVLIIDVQQALCSGEHEAFESRQVIERINLVSRQARAAGAPVVVIQHESRGGPLEYGAEGWRLAEGLEIGPKDIHVRKTAADSFHNTDLQSVLLAHNAKRLAICGFQSEFCVDTTTRRALALGYPVILVADAHSTRSNGVLSAAQIRSHHNETLANINSFGPRVTLLAASEVNFDP
jgi:nicotinamidase-related amidase